MESKGIALARKAAEEADVTLIVFDAAGKTSPTAIKDFETLPCRNKIFILNKTDLKPGGTFPKSLKAVRASAKTGTGIDKIKKAMLGKAGGGAGDGEGTVITSERQKNCLKKALQFLEAAGELLDREAGEELLSVEIRLALSAISTVTGEVTDDDILNRIFARFCIGK